MLAKLEILFGQYALYIIAGFGALSLVMGAGWYVSNLKLDAERQTVKTVSAQLDVSNGSIASMKDNFAAIMKTLNDNAVAERALQSDISKQLSGVILKDQSKAALEARLVARPASTTCVTPKDLSDAWNQM